MKIDAEKIQRYLLEIKARSVQALALIFPG
jgi:hypothetical protein